MPDAPAHDQRPQQPTLLPRGLGDHWTLVQAGGIKCCSTGASGGPHGFPSVPFLLCISPRLVVLIESRFVAVRPHLSLRRDSALSSVAPAACRNRSAGRFQQDLLHAPSTLVVALGVVVI